MLSPFAARIYRPARPALAAARRAVAGCRGAREAWSALGERGIVPAGWLDAPLRRFRSGGRAHVHGRDGERVLISECPNALPSRVQPYPAAIEDAVLFASDVEAIGQVEASAREVAARLAPWDSGFEGAVPARTVWQTSGWAWELMPSELRDLHFQPAPLLAIEVCGLVWKAIYQLGEGVRASAQIAAEEALPNGRPWIVALARHADASWRVAASVGARVPAKRDEHPMYRAGPISIAGRPFAELPNPFEPMLAVYSLGYALAAITNEAIALVAPPPVSNAAA